MIKIFGNLQEIKTGKLQEIVPELYLLKEVIENNPWHDHQSVFDHTLKVLGNLESLMTKASPKISSYLEEKIGKYTKKDLLFLAALLHDIAKGETLKKEGDQTSCPGHEEAGAKKAKKILTKFDLSEEEKERVCQIVLNHGKTDLTQCWQKFKQENLDIYPELVLLILADIGDGYLKETDPGLYSFKMSFYQKQLEEF